MKSSTLILLSAACVMLLGGCASQSMLPQSANEVQFVGGQEGKVGWSSYREEAVFKGVTKEQVIQAAKAGLGDAGFALKRVDKEAGVVLGEHGMTLHDWNIVAGVYAKEKNDEVLTVVIAEGSKDIGFSGDVTGDAWTGKILKGMREFLKKFQ